mmetsp:Transcript_4939/g.10955  ORF Transcript_4939/g.10955 Transcript_4939/m.10955 type:complete len:248 (-) Transcript_4939:215-958(-)
MESEMVSTSENSIKTALPSSRLYYSTDEHLNPSTRLGLNVTESIKSSEGGDQSEYECVGHAGKLRCLGSSGDDVRRVRPMREHFQDMKGGPRDALMELARENLILHQHLYLANVEVLRLKGVVRDFEDSGCEVIVECKKPYMGQQQSQSRYWTAEEHLRFLDAIQTIEHKDVKAIAQFVGTRNSTQVRTHAQKYFMKLARERRQAHGLGGGERLMPQDTECIALDQDEEDEEEMLVRRNEERGACRA